MTMTDNGGGGQPVSMANFKKLAEKTHAQGKLVWIDGCRIYENALFIKAFESGYENFSLNHIVKEILSYCDAATMSFKKMYAHMGGGILINRDSKILNAKTLKGIDFTIKRMTTTDYGNGYRSYSGLTGEGMIEMMTGLMCVVDEAICGERIA
jgi:tryptophanase